MSAKQIEIVRILNPLDPRQRQYEKLDWVPGKSLEDYFPYSVLHTEELVISVSGKVVMPEEFKRTFLTPTDSLVICPVPLGGGGGGGKGIIRLVAMIAISVFAPYAAAAINTSMGLGFAAGSVGMTLMTAGITMVGGMLVNALLPQKPAQTNTRQGDTLDSSPSYGLDGPKNSASEGIPVPVCYGTFRMGGNLINFYVDNVGSTQFMYLLFNAGEGPVANITDIQINDQPIETYSNYVIETRSGLPTQAPIGWFDDQVQPHNINLRVVHDDWINYTTSQEIDKFRLDFYCPVGMYIVDAGSGITYAHTVDLIVEYRKVGDADWTQLSDTNGIVGYTSEEVCEVVEHEYVDTGYD